MTGRVTVLLRWRRIGSAFRPKDGFVISLFLTRWLRRLSVTVLPPLTLFRFKTSITLLHQSARRFILLLFVLLVIIVILLIRLFLFSSLTVNVLLFTCRRRLAGTRVMVKTHWLPFRWVRVRGRGLPRFRR